MSDVHDATRPAPQSNHAEPTEKPTGTDPADPAAGLLDKTKTGLKEKMAGQKNKIEDTKGKIIAKASPKLPAGGLDRTPFPDAPQGYTVKIVFRTATNLPAADIATRSADPYIHATLTSAVPRRHKEDPTMTHRTRTMRRTTDPEWNDEWIVANVPASGFSLKCRLYDEDWPDHDDRLGNVTIEVPHVDDKWEGLGAEGRTYKVKKHMGSKRAYLIKGIASMLSKDVSMTPLLTISIDVVGKSDPPHAQMYTVGPTTWTKHYSPMIGRLAGVKVNRDEEQDAEPPTQQRSRQLQKYDFQANQMQLAGPVPPTLYHRYVEFRPVIGLMFASTGLRGRILNKALHKQHARIYNYDSSTETGTFEACSEAASLQLLRMAHFDEGGRLFTYVLTLDGVLRFTETGREFGIDMLSKHTMHSDVATYIACSGEFFIRRLEGQDPDRHPDPGEPTPPSDYDPDAPLPAEPPRDPRHYQLVIDNDSGTYRPDKAVLPDLQAFLQRNFPGLGVVAKHWEDEELKAMKDRQASVKKKEGRAVPLVLNRSPSSSSFSSDDASRLGRLERDGHATGSAAAGSARVKSKKEKALDVLQDPGKLKGLVGLGGDASGSEAKAEREPQTGHGAEDGGTGAVTHSNGEAKGGDAEPQ